MPHFDFASWIATQTREVDRALDRFLPKATAKPATIHKAMRYSLLAGGKRMRPALVLAAAEACGGRMRRRCLWRVLSSVSTPTP